MQDNESKELVPQPKTKDGRDFPLDIYSPQELESVYVQKGFETNNAVSHLDDDRFTAVIDRILGGATPREISIWYKTTYGEPLSFKAIQEYIDNYIPADVKEQITISTDLFKDAKIDEISMITDLIKAQKARITEAYRMAKKARKMKVPFDFDFTHEFDLLYKMLAKTIELKQSMGILPKIADKKEVKKAELKLAAKLPAQAAANILSSESVAKVLDIAERLRSQQESKNVSGD